MSHTVLLSANVFEASQLKKRFPTELGDALTITPRSYRRVEGHQTRILYVDPRAEGEAGYSAAVELVRRNLVKSGADLDARVLQLDAPEFAWTARSIRPEIRITEIQPYDGFTAYYLVEPLNDTP